jgi:hypothetical protein
LHDAPEIIEVAGEAIHAMHDDGITMAHEGAQLAHR